MTMIDISVLVGDMIPVWEGDNRPAFEEEKTDYPNGTIQVTTVNMNVHTGTHIDAPRHFYQEKEIATHILLDRLVGSCQVVEVLSTKRLITKEDIEQIDFTPDCERILFKTINSQLWEKGNQFEKNYIALDVSAAEYLIHKGIKLVGIDYLSIAPFDNVWDVHQALLSKDIVILEGLNLKNVSAGNYELICLPLKLDSKDGLPVRAVLRK